MPPYKSRKYTRASLLARVPDVHHGGHVIQDNVYSDYNTPGTLEILQVTLSYRKDNSLIGETRHLAICEPA